jgi:C1A family cysteine protease
VQRKFGWVKDAPDKRDKLYSASVKPAKKSPTAVDLRAEFPPVYAQGNMNSCHDDETEILTDRGFRLFSELDGTDLLATVDPSTSDLSFEKPSRLIRMPYTGPMVCADGDSLNFKVTPEHRMLVRKWDATKRTLSDTYELVEAAEIGWYCGLMNRINWSGDEAASETFTLPGVDHEHKPQREPLTLPMRVWLRFLGIYLAEGTVLQEIGRYKIQLAASKTREKEFIRRVLSDMGQHFLELKDRFTFENRRLYETMEALGLKGVYAPEKFVPEFVFHQSATNIRELLLGHWMGDGSEQDGVRSHHTSSNRLANDLERLIFLSGDEASWTSRAQTMSVMTDGRIIEAGHDMHRISVKARKNLSIEMKEQIFSDHYSGTVYCAEVPTHHTLVTRRHGKILISGNCTANAIAAAVEFDEIHQKMKGRFVPSRLFIYYNERAMEGTVDKDSGGQIRDGIKSIASQGVPHEDLWEYDERLLKVKPNSKSYAQAKRYKTVKYLRMMHNLDELRSCLASGFPFVFGIKVYASFVGQQVANTGVVRMPKKGEKVAGLHAVVACGYDDSAKRFIVRNSYGTDWGMNGNFSIPYSYLLDPRLAHDFWTLRLIR